MGDCDSGRYQGDIGVASGAGRVRRQSGAKEMGLDFGRGLLLGINVGMKTLRCRANVIARGVMSQITLILVSSETFLGNKRLERRWPRLASLTTSHALAD